LSTLACSGSSKGAVSVRIATDTRAEIRDAHLSRPVLIDGGTLRLDPISGTARVSEAQALALFRAGSMPFTQVENVMVVYAAATMRLAVNDKDSLPRPRVAPVFTHRAAWTFIWSERPIFCGESPQTSPAPEAQSVELLAADGSGEGLTYQTRGSLCGNPVSPQVGIASYWVSLAWTVASRTGVNVVLRFATPPVCGDESYAPYTSSATSVTFRVYAEVLLAKPPCFEPRPKTTIVRSAPTTATLFHVKTGLTVSRSNATRNRDLTYYDGTTHTIK